MLNLKVSKTLSRLLIKPTVYFSMCLDVCGEFGYYCTTDRKCISKWSRCNYSKDCSNNEDEIECGKIKYLLNETNKLVRR